MRSALPLIVRLRCLFFRYYTRPYYHFLFFFLRIRPPPRSTLFPHPTLFRSRKSLGARRRDILRQFLVEATTLATAGAAGGVVLGIGLASAVAALPPVPAAVAPWSILVGVVLGAGVGVVAGVYPASRAARLDPIAALRHET